MKIKFALFLVIVTGLIGIYLYDPNKSSSFMAILLVFVVYVALKLLGR